MHNKVYCWLLDKPVEKEKSLSRQSPCRACRADAVCIVARAVCAVVSAHHRWWFLRSSVCPSLSCVHPVLYHACRPDLWVATRNSLSQHHPCKPCCDKKSYVAIGIAQPRKTLSRHKGTLVATQTPCPNPKPCCDTEFLLRHRVEKYMSRQRKALSRPKPPSMPRNSVATRRSLSRHRARKLCRVRTSAVHYRDISLMSQHGKIQCSGILCRDGNSLSRQRTLRSLSQKRISIVTANCRNYIAIGNSFSRQNSSVM